ncbi:MAG: hypothetical protein H7101_10475 [Deinococcales bacterium]|nr:hypothetical protein [Chitinophagaceae bacterium]
MEDKKILIKMNYDKIYFNPEIYITLDDTNIPKGAELRFSTKKEVIWEVEMVGYSDTEKNLTIKILNYYPTATSSFFEQKPKKPIQKLTFKGDFIWSHLEPVLISYVKDKLKGKLSHYTPKESRAKETLSFQLISKSYVSNENPLNIIPDPIKKEDIPTKTYYKEEFWIDFSDVKFKLGYVAFKKYIQANINASLDFKIPNDNILEEFDCVKFWFAKKLKTKKISVEATVVILEGKVLETMAKSKQIDLITPELIDSVKYQRTIAITEKLRDSKITKELFTADEIFSQIDSTDEEGNVFKQNEKDILDFLLEKKNVRNKKELTYLSGNKQSINHKIRYTSYPNFGFLFLIEGEENNHFVWELLESNATYIWTIYKSQQEIDLQYRRIEAIINTIRDKGRNSYKRYYKNNHHDSDIRFSPIDHTHIGSELIDEFPKWKSRLNERIT